MKSEYEVQADELAKKLGLSLTSRYVGTTLFPNDDNKILCDEWKCRLSRNRKSYAFSFYMGVGNKGRKPTMYDILSSITKRDCGTFEEFCSDFGYDTDSRSAERVYKGCVKEFNAMSRLFNEDELDELMEIC